MGKCCFRANWRSIQEKLTLCTDTSTDTLSFVNIDNSGIVNYKTTNLMVLPKSAPLTVIKGALD